MCISASPGDLPCQAHNSRIPDCRSRSGMRYCDTDPQDSRCVGIGNGTRVFKGPIFDVTGNPLAELVQVDHFLFK